MTKSNPNCKFPLDLEKKLNILIADVQLLKKKEKEKLPPVPVVQKNYQWRDWFKLAGTCIVLFSWGFENYVIKPDESAKLQQQFDRTILNAAADETNAQEFGSRVFDYVYLRDSSEMPKRWAFHYTAEYARAIEAEIYAFKPILYKKEKEDQEWIDNLNARHISDIKLIYSNKNQGKIVELNSMISDLGNRFDSMQPAFQAYNRKYYQLSSNIVYQILEKNGHSHLWFHFRLPNYKNFFFHFY